MRKRYIPNSRLQAMPLCVDYLTICTSISPYQYKRANSNAFVIKTQKLKTKLHNFARTNEYRICNLAHISVPFMKSPKPLKIVHHNQHFLWSDGDTLKNST
jgi:hypothetical protein